MIYHISAKAEIDHILRDTIRGMEIDYYTNFAIAAEILARREDKVRKESVIAGAIIAAVVFAMALIGYWVISRPPATMTLQDRTLPSGYVTADTIRVDSFPSLGRARRGYDSVFRAHLTDSSRGGMNSRDISPDIQRAYDSERAEAWPEDTSALDIHFESWQTNSNMVRFMTMPNDSLYVILGDNLVARKGQRDKKWTVLDVSALVRVRKIIDSVREANLLKWRDSL